MINGANVDGTTSWTEIRQRNDCGLPRIMSYCEIVRAFAIPVRLFAGPTHYAIPHSEESRGRR